MGAIPAGHHWAATRRLIGSPEAEKAAKRDFVEAILKRPVLRTVHKLSHDPVFVSRGHLFFCQREPGLLFTDRFRPYIGEAAMVKGPRFRRDDARAEMVAIVMDQRKRAQDLPASCCRTHG